MAKETVIRMRKHPDGYWVLFGQRNKRLGILVQPTYAESLGLTPTLDAVASAIRELDPTYPVVTRVINDEL